jgi:hypothetical protein
VSAGAGASREALRSVAICSLKKLPLTYIILVYKPLKRIPYGIELSLMK